jgi:hypothetical protein
MSRRPPLLRRRHPLYIGNALGIWSAALLLAAIGLLTDDQEARAASVFISFVLAMLGTTMAFAPWWWRDKR